MKSTFLNKNNSTAKGICPNNEIVRAKGKTMTMIDAAKAIVANTAPTDINFPAINAAARTTTTPVAVNKIELLVILATATTIPL